MIKTASELVVGDVILLGAGKTEKVVQLDFTRCKNKVHVNHRDCYEPFAELRVQNGKVFDATPEQVMDEPINLGYMSL